jgi:hypothetical protein
MKRTKQTNLGAALKNASRLALLLTALSFAGGCGTVASRRAVQPARTFPPVKPAVVRLPVEITFPSGGDFVRHISNFFKGGIRQMIPSMPDLPGLNLKSHIALLWADMQDPILLDDNLWLLIRPATLSVGMMRTDLKRASTAHTVLEMTAMPEIIFGPKPLAKPLPMPPLQPFKPGPGTFQAMSNTLISFKEANQYFRDPRLNIIGMKFPGTGDRKVVLEGIRLSGSGGQVLAEVKLRYNPPFINLSGKPAKMTVYLRGTPRYLPKQRAFDMPDLDFDIKSSDLMVQIADWLFKSDFKKELRGIAKLPIGPKLDVIKGKVNAALNRPLGSYVRLHTQVNSFKVLDGIANDEGIEIRLSIMGTATMEVTWN